LTKIFDEKKFHTVYGGISDHGAAAYILFYEKVDQNRQINKQLIVKYASMKMPGSPGKNKGK
jgi:hypothetical protein